MQKCKFLGLTIEITVICLLVLCYYISYIYFQHITPLSS